MSGIPAGAGQLLGKRLGKFEILALLALGGTAEIYLARIGGAAGFEKYVVVKCLHDHLADDAEFVKMFLDEARLAAHLDHSNIVQTMELGQYEGRYYMVMEFLAGLSLAMIVRRVSERLPNTRIPVPLVLNILAQSAAGLHYAHEKAMNGKPLHIVHRDISPQNLVISFEGVVKLVDFGIAKAELRETRTRSGTIKGKFAYMSPEQCVANNVDRRTDVFALGVIGHELLTGRRLFKRASPYETYQAVMECDVKPPSIDGSGEPALDQVILRALAKDKEQRYPTAEAFGDALLGYLHHRGMSSGPGDVARFFEAHFGQEIEEHSGRMRELIAGRDISMTAGVSWGSDDPDDEAKRERAADSARRHAVARTIGAQAGPIGESIEAGMGEAGLGGMFDDAGGGSRSGDDDEMPAERTRIETNPLERINELEKLAARTPRPVRIKGGKSAPPQDAPAAVAAGSAGTPSAAGTAGAPGAPSSGRFPDLANLPTMIAGDQLVVPAQGGFPSEPASTAPAPSASDFADVPTTLSPGHAAPGGHVSAPTLSPDGMALGAPSAPTLSPEGSLGAQLGFASVPLASPAGFPSSPVLPPTDMPPGSFAGSKTLPPDAVVPASLPLGGPLFSNVPVNLPGHPPAHPAPGAPGPSAAAAMPMGYPLPGPNGDPGPRPNAGSAPPLTHPAPAGYPVMDAEMSAQMKAGATVFPSEHRAPPIPRPPGTPDGDPFPRGSEPFARDGAPYSPEGAPYPPDGAAYPPPDAYPPDGAAYPPPDAYPPDGAAYPPSGPRPSPMDPQLAAQLMSPVGQHYPEPVDWDAAAAAPAKAVPSWLLAILFIAALGLALGLTIVVARVAG